MKEEAWITRHISEVIHILTIVRQVSLVPSLFLKKRRRRTMAFTTDIQIGETHINPQSAHTETQHRQEEGKKDYLQSNRLTV